MTLGRILRIVGALAILIGGIVHLDLYFNADYRYAGDQPNFGRSILLNVIASAVIAAAVAARKEWFVRLAGIAVAVGTIALFLFVHTNHQFLGFAVSGKVFEPSPQATVAMIVELIAIITLAATFVPAIDQTDVSLPTPALGASVAVAAIAVIAFSVHWNSDSTSSVANAPIVTTPVAPTTPTAATTPAAGTSAAPGSAPAATTAPAGSTAPAAGGSAVSIKNFAFAAKSITVAKGTTVTWTNNDGVKHSVVADDKSFRSDGLAQGATFQFTFNTPGTFTYICGIHPYMKGTIVVSG
jgi:plastocyanin